MRTLPLAAGAVPAARARACSDLYEWARPERRRPRRGPAAQGSLVPEPAVLPRARRPLLRDLDPLRQLHAALVARAGRHRRRRRPSARCSSSAAAPCALRADHDLRLGRLGDVARAALVLDDLRHADHRRAGAERLRLRHPGPHAARRPRAGCTRSPTPSSFHDLGKLLLAFVMLYAYFAFSQFLIIWSGNLPEETPWYLKRHHAAAGSAGDGGGAAPLRSCRSSSCCRAI